MNKNECKRLKWAAVMKEYYTEKPSSPITLESSFEFPDPVKHCVSIILPKIRFHMNEYL